MLSGASTRRRLDVNTTARTVWRRLR
jgi:hypothetical protein